MGEVLPFLVAAFTVLLTAGVAFSIAVHNRLRALEIEQARQDEKSKPLWARLQTQIAEELHQPHPRYFRMDQLLEDLEALTITPPDRRELKELLEQRTHDMSPDITDAQRKSAALLILVMDKVVIEADKTIADKIVTGILVLLSSGAVLQLRRWA